MVLRYRLETKCLLLFYRKFGNDLLFFYSKAVHQASLEHCSCRAVGLEPQSNRRVQVVKTYQSEDNRSLVHRGFEGICSVVVYAMESSEIC